MTSRLCSRGVFLYSNSVKGSGRQPEHPACQRVSQGALLKRALLVRCPNCGRPGIFANAFRLYPRCPDCGLKFQRSDGFYLGAMTLNYGLTVFGALPPIVLLALFGVLTLVQAAVISAVVAVVVPILIYRLAWSLWLGIYYLVLPHELPANETELIPTHEDE